MTDEELALLLPDHMSDIMDGVKDEVEQRVEKGGVDLLGVPSGFRRLDDATLGFRKNAYYILGGRTSIGKTAAAVSMMRYIAEANYKVLYISLEMSSQLLAYRLLSSLSEVPTLSIETGKLQPDQLRRVRDAHEVLRTMSITLFDRSLSTVEMTGMLKQAQDKQGFDLLIIDYATLVRTPDPYASAYERVTTISDFIRHSARDLDVPILALAQLNREAERREDKTPVLSDLRDSGSLEQDAHAVILAHRPHYYAKLYEGAEPKNVEDDALLILAKNRQGPTGRIPVHFIANRMEWIDPQRIQRQPQSLADLVRMKR